MFTSKSRPSYAENPAGSTTIIGAGAVISGNIESAGDIRIDGILKGNLTCKAKILLGPEAVIEGDIVANQADILGRVQQLQPALAVIQFLARANRARRGAGNAG